ncbi:MAG: AMP-binding protein [Beijerinckiaceae bacterium]|nr:AMP-binding protein [Beijerinckiaceae bacterium]
MERAAEFPWLKSYPANVSATIDVNALQNLADILRDSFRKFANRTAFTSLGKSITYADLQRDAEALVVALQARGLKKGDCIGLMMPNVMAYPVALSGLLLGGYTVVAANPLYTARELQHQMKDAGAKAIIVLENFAHVLEQTLPALDLELVIIAKPGDCLGLKGVVVNLVSKYVKKAVTPYTIPKAVAFSDLLSFGRGKTPTPVSIALDDIAFLQYTGGTTGVSKGAVLTHRNVSANLEQVLSWHGPAMKASPYADNHCMVTALPLYHIFALTCCGLFMIRAGGSCLLIANPRDMPGFVKTLQTSHFTLLAGVNTLFNGLMNTAGIEAVDFSKVSFYFGGGMAIQAPVAKRWKELTGRTITEGYGLSETSPVLTSNRADNNEFTSTIGYPIPSTEIMILKADGTTADYDEPGEICARGPQVMSGYWKRPDETAKVMTADGFFRTGDVGVMMRDGKVKIVDRMKDMILVSGFNVYPNEVEEVIASCPGVLEVAVVGTPDETTSEAVVAYVVKKDPDLTEAAVKQFCHENLTRYKCPKHVFFKEALPKTNVGKLLRRMLRDEAAGQGTPQA